MDNFFSFLIYKKKQIIFIDLGKGVLQSVYLQ